MSMLAIVTFDLHGAESKHYSQVKRKLNSIQLDNKIIAKDKDIPTKLPANTFAAKFSGEWSEKSAKELRNYLRKKICISISSLGLKASVFVAVGGSWAWGRNSV